MSVGRGGAASVVVFGVVVRDVGDGIGGLCLLWVGGGGFDGGGGGECGMCVGSGPCSLRACACLDARVGCVQ